MVQSQRVQRFCGEVVFAVWNDSAKLTKGCSRVWVVSILVMGKVYFGIVLVCSLRCEADEDVINEEEEREWPSKKNAPTPASFLTARTKTRMMSDYKVEMINDGMQVFYVNFHGPKYSAYQGGAWRIRVELADDYPYNSSSVGFINKIYPPNC